VEIDASQIFWVLTANSTDGIPAPLLNRMAVYQVPAPTAEQAAGIAQRIYRALLQEINLAMFATRLEPAVIDSSHRCRRATAQDLARQFGLRGTQDAHVLAEDVV
jgi:ATP-dependent Lon protease